MSRRAFGVLFLASAARSADPCLEDPSRSSCRGYVYPNASTDLASACTNMSSMPGCAVRQQCQVGGAMGAACNPFSLLVRVCDQMPMMGGCAKEQSICREGTAVAACEAPSLLSKMPTFSEALSAAVGICAAMPSMSGCGSCKGAGQCADPLKSLGGLCGEMPGMSECNGWLSWCQQPDAAATLPAFCTGVPPAGDDPPEMRMYFHTGWRDYVLFESWVPSSLSSYLGSIVAVGLLGVFSAWLRAVRTVVEARSWRASAKAGAGWPVLRANAHRAALVVLATTLDYMLMLVAMTYNVGLFAGVVLGLGLGTLLFSHWGRATALVPDNADDHAAPFLAHTAVREVADAPECCR